MKRTILFVLTALCSVCMMAQTKVTGTVTSVDDGQPIPFATVQVKGTTVGEYTDDNGKYTITVPADSVLIFSTIGFITQEIPVAGKAVINVALKTDAVTLDETIVVAYGTAKKGSFTGSASTVKSGAINDLPRASFESALVGTVAGLQMSPGSGQAGSSVSIRIRGTGSMNATNEPLYVIDGVPVISSESVASLDHSSNNVMNSINPNDIASITVLKDAAASALYGSRAANGVVIITTKSGSQGKMKLNFKASYGFTPAFAYNNLEKASPEDQKNYTLALYEAWAINAGMKGEEAKAKALKDWKDNVGDDPRGYFDWEDAILRTASFQNYDLSVTGGNDKTSYYASVGYTKEDGRVAANDLSRWSGRLNVSQKLYTNDSQKLFSNVELLSNISFSATNKNGFNDTYNNGNNYFLMVRNLLYDSWWPTTPNGDWVTTRYRSYGQNVLYYDQFRENLSKMNRLSINETLGADILKNLKFKTVFSYDETRMDNFYWRASNHYDATSTSGVVRNSLYKMLKMVSSSTLNWNETFAGKHNINALVGFEAEKNKTDYVMGEGTNLPTLTSKTIETAGKRNSEGYYYGNNMLSILSRIEYNYDNRYYISGSYRRDGSSKLTRDERWGNFWSVSGSWRIKEESFLRDNKVISNLRIKASYGVNGTLPDPNYGTISLYSLGQNYNGNPGGYISTVADSRLSWETNYTYNLGFELGLFDNRLNLNMEYYNRDSKNLLQDVPISRITGFGTILSNFGAMNNSGLEIELSGDIIRTKNTKWFLSINGSTLSSKVTKLYDGADIIWYDPTGGDSQCRFIYREGYSPKSFYGKEWAGVDPANGDPLWYTNNSDKGVKEINGRSVTNKFSNAKDVIYGNADPKFFGGINTNFSWKGLSVDLNFAYSLGGYAFNSFERYMNDDGYFTARTRAEKAMDYWKKPGDVTQAPRLGISESELFKRDQNRWAYKNNYLRLKNLGVSYNLPQSIINRIKLSNLRIYFSGTNLLTFASQKEFDPEVSAFGTTSWQMPLGKTYTFGIEISL